MNSRQTLLKQIKRAVVPKLFFMLLFVIGSASAVYFYAAQTQLINQHENYIKRLISNLTTNVNNLTSNIDNMAQNDLLINGIIDFEMRDEYLPIFFQGLRVFKTKEMGVALFDFSGTAFLEKDWPADKISELQPSWQDTVYKQGQNYIHIDHKGVVAISPIFISSSVEGALGSYLKNLDSLVDIVFEQDLKQYIFDQNGTLLWSSFPDKDITSVDSLMDSLSFEFHKTEQWHDLTIISTQPYSTAYIELLWLMPFFLLSIFGASLSALLSMQLSAKKASVTLKNMHNSLVRMSANQDLIFEDRSTIDEAEEFKNIRQSFTELLEKVANLSLSNDRVNNVINSLRTLLVVVTPKGEVILSNCKDDPLFDDENGSSEQLIREGLSNINSNGFYVFTTSDKPGDNARTIEWSIAPYKDQQGRRLGYVFNGKDISMRLTLQKDINLRRQAMDISPASISIADVSKPGNPLIYVNQAFCKVTGFSESEALGRNCKFLQGPTTEQDKIEIIKQALRNRTSCQVELTNYKKNGETFINNLSLQPVTELDGTVDYFVGVQQDITIEKRTEQYLALAREQAEQTTRAQGRFFASINHELRTPINGINGMINALLSTDLSEQQRKHAELASMSANNLMLIVNDVLDYSKAESGQLQIEPSQFDLTEFCNKLYEYYKLQCQNKNLIFKWVGIPNSKLMICADRLRLQQILDNLVNNAIKFTESGQITLKTKLKDIVQSNESVQEQPLLRIDFDVIDTGIGIAADQIQNVFKMFGQVKSSSKKLLAGTGLGLNIAKQLANMMHGELSVTSKVNQGSTFSFYIVVEKFGNEDNATVPAATGINNDILSFCSSHVRPTTPVNQKPEKPTVLIVEDNEINQEVVTSALPDAKKLVASNGFQALDILKKVKTDIDVVLMDCQMPELDGWETTRMIRDGHATGLYIDIPIVALTAYTTLADQEECKQAGMNDYLSKPFNPEQLTKKVDFWTFVRRQSELKKSEQTQEQ